MADCERVPTEVIDAALRGAESIRRFYLAGGGSEDDLRTDISYVAEAVLDALAVVAVPTSSRKRVVSTPAYAGPERRRPSRRP